jgi:hypothetical protein
MVPTVDHFVAAAGQRPIAAEQGFFQRHFCSSAARHHRLLLRPAAADSAAHHLSCRRPLAVGQRGTAPSARASITRGTNDTPTPAHGRVNPCPFASHGTRRKSKVSGKSGCTPPTLIAKAPGGVTHLRQCRYLYRAFTIVVWAARVMAQQSTAPKPIVWAIANGAEQIPATPTGAWRAI